MATLGKLFVVVVLVVGFVIPQTVRAEEDWRKYFTLRELRQPSLGIGAAGAFGKIMKAQPKAPFFLPEDATNKGGLFGADVSHYDLDCSCPTKCAIDWKSAAVKQGIRFVYAEASRGVDWVDPTFVDTWAALKPLFADGIIYRGAYHWLSSDTQLDGTDQAKWFLKHINDGTGSLPLAVDFEPDYIQVTKNRYDQIKGKAECKTKTVGKMTFFLCDGWYGQKPEAIVTKLKNWIQTVEAAKRTAIIYTNALYWNSMIADKGTDLLSTRGVWLARYLDPADFPDAGKPQSTSPPVNSWGMPQLPANLRYPVGPAYSSRTNWQFEECGQFRQTVWSCKAKPVAGPAPDKSVCPTATSAVMDMDWYPSSLADFKAAFGLK